MSYTSDRVVYRNAWGIQPMQEDKMRSLGFVFNDIRDALPHQVILPLGWTIKETSHHPLIVDENSLTRGYIEVTKHPQSQHGVYVLLKLFK